jgi:hypothetical protein
MGNGLTLNVILHGTFAYIDKKSAPFIYALIPEPNSKGGVDHVFRAGNWLGETELRPGTYELRGVKGGTAGLDAARNLIYEHVCRLHPRNPHTEYAKFIFPRPKSIASLRLAKVDLKTHPKSRPPRLKGHLGAALQVFTYEVENDQALCLQKMTDDDNSEGSGHFWEPIFTGNYASLQIFSAEDHPDDPAHTRRVFHRVAALLGVRNIELNEVHRSGGIDDAELPEGVIAEETEDLAARTLRIARLGRLRRQNADLNQAWYGNEALDGNPDACLSQGCQYDN